MKSDFRMHAEKLCKNYGKYFPLDKTFFFGRIGWPKHRIEKSRSMRLDFSEIVVDERLK